MSGEIGEDFKQAVSDWVELKMQLAEARKDMKILNGREKQLKSFIAGKMKSGQIDTVNLRQGKISLKKSIRRTGLTKNKIEEGLKQYFNNDEIKLEGALNAINDTIETKETQVISLTGIKKKTDD